jgi:hypothetical protein
MTIGITRTELDQIRKLPIRRRSDWPAVFSTNCNGEVWLWATYGLTPDDYREQIRGVSEVTDLIADEYLEIRGEGGRFFVDATGAFYKDESGRWTRQFVNFRHCS